MDIIPKIIKTAIQAGEAILNIYYSGFKVSLKNDQSPLTEADNQAHKIIKNSLSETGFPMLSEEGKEISYEKRRYWKKFWMVDPLDGTKEFIKKNGEFTVNIALIEKNKPVFGVVYAPVPDLLYIGYQSEGAFKIESASFKLKNRDISKWYDLAYRLPFIQNRKSIRIVASRSHLSRETEDYIKRIKEEQKIVEFVSKGSSLKLCMIAEGEADIYPRFAPTMEWDTAAGHAVLKASGGKIFQPGLNEKELIYNKPYLLNPWFIAFSKINLLNKGYS